MECERAALDGMGAQARQARRVQSSAPRRDRHELRRAARRPGGAALGPLRHHARFRHAPADGRRTSARRHAVAPAEPAAVRCAAATRHRRIRRPAAACRRQRRERQPHAVRAGLLGTRRPRPVHDARSPTSIRTCFTRAASSARASTTSMRSKRRSPGACPKTPCSATTSSKGLTPAPGSAPTSTSSTTTRRTTSRSRHGSTAGSAATGRSSAGSGEPSRTRAGAPVPNTLPAVARWKILDNLRRSLLPPALVALFMRGLDGAPGLGDGLDGAGVDGPRLSGLRAGRPLAIEPRPRRTVPRARARRARQRSSPAPRQALLSTVFLLHQSWVMLDAIGRTLVRMLITRRRLLEWVTADRSSHVEAFPRRGLLRRMAPAPACSGRASRSSSGGRAGRLPLAPAHPRAVVRLAAARLRDRQPGHAPARAANLRRAADSAANRAADVAVLRRARRPRRQLAHPRQRAGEPPRANRAPHLADEHRSAAAVDAGGP